MYCISTILMMIGIMGKTCANTYSISIEEVVISKAVTFFFPGLQIMGQQNIFTKRFGTKQVELLHHLVTLVTIQTMQATRGI
jgi:hypothetical protein